MCFDLAISTLFIFVSGILYTTASKTVYWVIAFLFGVVYASAAFRKEDKIVERLNLIEKRSVKKENIFTVSAGDGEFMVITPNGNTPFETVWDSQKCWFTEGELVTITNFKTGESREFKK